jgi:hypothetical protein
VSERICVVDLSQPIYAAPVDRVCAVEIDVRPAHVVAASGSVDSSFPLIVAVALVVGSAFFWIRAANRELRRARR